MLLFFGLHEEGKGQKKEEKNYGAMRTILDTQAPGFL
jgi:hypothetical protein